MKALIKRIKKCWKCLKRSPEPEPASIFQYGEPKKKMPLIRIVEHTPRIVFEVTPHE